MTGAGLGLVTNTEPPQTLLERCCNQIIQAAMARTKVILHCSHVVKRRKVAYLKGSLKAHYLSDIPNRRIQRFEDCRSYTDLELKKPNLPPHAKGLKLIGFE